MSPAESLLARIRGEYREMPGLRLTVRQAQRLWGLDGTTCHAVLTVLVDEGFLSVTRDGSFVALAGGELRTRTPLADRPMRRSA